MGWQDADFCPGMGVFLAGDATQGEAIRRGLCDQGRAPHSGLLRPVGRSMGIAMMKHCAGSRLNTNNAIASFALYWHK